MTTRRRFTAGAAAAAAGIVAAPAVARAATMKWKMVTSWPKRLPGPGFPTNLGGHGLRCLR